MNNLHFDTRLVASAKHSARATKFTKQTMKKVRKAAGQTPQLWRFSGPRRLAFAMVATLLIAMLAFTGYAYASGSDPVSLLKHWVEGDKVKIEYKGRVFEHGRTRTYSDAAITAYAELNTVDKLAFRAMQTFGIPKNGVEHVSDVYRHSEYVYPTFAIITKVEGESVSLTNKYVKGDKMNPSRDLDTPMLIAQKDLQLYTNGEPSVASESSVGKLVMLYTNYYIAHIIGTPTIKQRTVYFAFALSHSLEDFKAADSATAEGLRQSANGELPLYEPGWGGLATLCSNNSADACDYAKLTSDKAEGLYGKDAFGGTASQRSNPEAIVFGEGAATQNDQPFEMLTRNLQGDITDITATGITIKTSSGTLWQLDYSQSKREAFDREHSSKLKVGDHIAGAILQPVRDLDGRRVGNSQISTLVRI